MTKKKKNISLPALDAGYSFIDTHCHLDMSAYGDDLDEVINRAREAGVGRILTIGIDLESSGKAIELAGRYESIYASVGVHPHNVTELNDEVYATLRSMAKKPGVVAYGEIGIDCVKGYVPLDLQKIHFEKQVLFAKELDLPVIVHDREAHDDILAILQQAAPYPAGGVMHCFSGDAAFARQVIDLGLYVSIPGVVTFNNAATLQEAVETIPLSSLLIETDGPFLSPMPKRGKRNEPASLLFTAQKIAELKKISLEELARITSENATNLFRLPLD